LATGALRSYTIGVTFDNIRKFLSKKPWRPVEFVLDSGSTVRVEHVEDILMTLDGSRLWLDHDGEETVTSPEKIAGLRRARR
jgi:hypothetical protein